jgi:hypothetical protein
VTNTLHRYGSAQSFDDDFIVFAIPCKGKNDEGAVEKLRTFLEICRRHDPVSMGNAESSSFRPSGTLGPAVHWKRELRADHRSVIEGIRQIRTVAAVFDSRAKAESCLREVIAADLGLSVNVATSVEGARELARACGIARHSVEYSLGFVDPHDRLPDGQVLELSTMCGHGMVSANLARKMLDMVREGRREPEQAAVTLARFCPCGAFNPARARRLLEAARPPRS